MKKVPIAVLCLLVAAIVMLLNGAPLAEAVTCTVSELSPCAGAITSSSPPSAACCSKLKEQEPCLCGYTTNPFLKPYVNSPGAKKVASACGVPFPTC